MIHPLQTKESLKLLLERGGCAKGVLRTYVVKAKHTVKAGQALENSPSESEQKPHLRYFPSSECEAKTSSQLTKWAAGGLLAQYAFRRVNTHFSE